MVVVAFVDGVFVWVVGGRAVSGHKKPLAWARGERATREGGERYVSTTRRSAAIRMSRHSA